MVYAEDLWQFRQEVLDSKDSERDKFAGCCSLEKCASAEEWIRVVKNYSTAETCPKDKAPSTTYLAIRIADNKIIGIANLRYSLSNPILASWAVMQGIPFVLAKGKKGMPKRC